MQEKSDQNAVWIIQISRRKTQLIDLAANIQTIKYYIIETIVAFTDKFAILQVKKN